MTKKSKSNNKFLNEIRFTWSVKDHSGEKNKNGMPLDTEVAFFTDGFKEISDKYGWTEHTVVSYVDMWCMDEEDINNIVNCLKYYLAGGFRGIRWGELHTLFYSLLIRCAEGIIEARKELGQELTLNLFGTKYSTKDGYPDLCKYLNK